MKIISLVDKFKSTLTSNDIGKIIKDYYENNGHEVTYFPISDGGDGFLDTINYKNEYKKIYIDVKNALNEDINTYYLLKDDICFIESALVVGISKAKRLDIYNASTKGIGKIIIDAYNKGARKYYIGLGGTMTNDGGKGMLESLGFCFENNKVKYNKIIDLDNIEFNIISDVNNVLLGIDGATYMFAKQKGANDNDLIILEKRMNDFALLVNSYKNKDYTNIKGTGAAGGLGFAFISMLNANIFNGINFVIDYFKIDNIIDKYDYIITGEGKIDNQSFKGKVVFDIASRYKNKNIIAICGINETNKESYENIVHIYSIVPSIASFEDSMNNPKDNLMKLLSNIKLIAPNIKK